MVRGGVDILDIVDRIQSMSRPSHGQSANYLVRFLIRNKRHLLGNLKASELQASISPGQPYDPGKKRTMCCAAYRLVGWLQIGSLTTGRLNVT